MSVSSTMSSAGAADAGSSRWRIRAMSRFIGLITKKKTTAAVATNVSSAWRNAPYRNSAPLIEKWRSASPDLPTNIVISGEMKLDTKLWTTSVNAAPMTNATASSTTLPLRTKSRNSLRMPGRRWMVRILAWMPDGLWGSDDARPATAWRPRWVRTPSASAAHAVARHDVPPVLNSRGDVVGRLEVAP